MEEFQPKHGEECQVNISCNQWVQICKLFGPLCVEDIRVKVDFGSSEWIVERNNVATGIWEEKIRWDCQESYPNPEDEKREEK